MTDGARPSADLTLSHVRSVAPPRLFAALEGWRGVCACLVALFHFRQLGYDNVSIPSHIGTAGVVQNAYLFVDFFFVLSGFVIAASYGARLVARTVRLRDFLVLRLGRLYPLHAFTLGLMVVEEWYRHWYTLRTPAEGAFVAYGNTLPAFALNVALLQGLHVSSMTTWNRPSWSISAEFAAYVVFAVVWAVAGRRSWIVTGATVACAPVALWRLKGHIDATYDWGAVRATLGFALGVTVHHLATREWWTRSRGRLSWGAETAMEMALVVAIAAFVGWVGRRPASIAAPFLFAAGVAVFSRERGLLGAVFASRPMRALGRWSYSIYMLHFPVQQLLFWIFVAGSAAGWFRIVAGDPLALQVSRTAADALNGVMLVTVIGASAWVYRWVETPWRERTRALVARRQPAWRKVR
ncbi:MAG: acyltransferase [Proteobacteria bacterium]|nr:acyltransferase [Pseudomonadota bacterium]